MDSTTRYANSDKVLTVSVSLTMSFVALGRCTSTQHWCLTFRTQRSDPLLQRYRYVQPSHSFMHMLNTHTQSHSSPYCHLILPHSLIQFNTGYRHNPFQHCPQGESHKRGKCWCDPTENFDYEWYSCLKRYDGLFE